MTERLNAIRNNLLNGIPYDDLGDTMPQAEFEQLTTSAEEACLAAHKSLYERFAEDDQFITVFSDPDSHERDKYISFMDNDCRPIYGAWDAKNPATDIGIRGANPRFPTVANPTTIVHADTQATQGFKERGAPQVAIEAIDAVARLNHFIEEHVARPYLELVAEAAALERDTYLAHFFAQERGRRLRILTRVIMYHLDVRPQQRPIGSDGAPLLIKEHNDRSSWTIDVKQTEPGLQYYYDDEWHDATTHITAFRGAADSYLPFNAPPLLHRAVVREAEPERRLTTAGIARIAIPTFISPLGDHVRVVRPSSFETHPQQSANRPNRAESTRA